ncbi:hypothetical protein [Streptomyces albipurpureus]|uniref:Uncharacterized protein n=1 Tax=Streptomyces albipurpureus TaxID=2897419 RepID=A0ABT0UTZ0_9ACTN|nr:hypothetical protein [Streptomyces sp. CWNU-1]MCM2392044.1 hypothetical protein [Streptomyces sp. CWNU-1]
MFKRKRDNREWRETQRAAQEMMQWADRQPDPTSTPQQDPDPTAVDDFLPPDLLSASQGELAGMMMPWRGQLIVDGEVRTCPQCGADRDWMILSTRGLILLRCHAGHETPEPALDTVWFNRNSGPMEHRHTTLEDGLKYFGH